MFRHYCNQAKEFKVSEEIGLKIYRCIECEYPVSEVEDIEKLLRAAKIVKEIGGSKDAMIYFGSLNIDYGSLTKNLQIREDKISILKWLEKIIEGKKS